MSPPLVVLAAGLSMRFGRLKQLAQVGPGGEAIMDYNVYDALQAGFKEVTYVVRPEILDDLKSHVSGVFGSSQNFRFVIQDLTSLPVGFNSPTDRRQPWGTAHAVLCAAEVHAGPMVVCNADDLYGPAAFRQLYDHLTRDPLGSESALIGYPLRDTLVGGGGVARGLCHVGREGLLEHVIEVRDVYRRDAWIVGVEAEGMPIDLSGDEMVSMNLWALTPSMVAGIRHEFSRFLDRWGAHPSQELFLSTAVNGHIQTYDSRVRVLGAKDSWLGITYAEDQERFQTMLEERIEAGAYPRHLAHHVPKKA